MHRYSHPWPPLAITRRNAAAGARPPDRRTHFVTQHGYGVGYTRDPRQAVPPDCGFVRFRTPGGVLFTSAGLVKFHKRGRGGTACQAFAALSATPMEVQMDFPRVWSCTSSLRLILTAWKPSKIPSF